MNEVLQAAIAEQIFFYEYIADLNYSVSIDLA